MSLLLVYASSIGCGDCNVFHRYIGQGTDDVDVMSLKMRQELSKLIDALGQSTRDIM